MTNTPLRLRNCHRAEEIKETWQLQATWDPGLDCGTGKGHEKKNYTLINSDVPILIYWF